MVSFLVIVPTLNSFALLPQLVSSLQCQTFKSWRLLFVDGPSRPEHRDWLKQCCLADSRCSWIPQDQAEVGIFGAMNQGFSAALGSEYLMFWGSDDWAASDHALNDLSLTIREDESFGNSPYLYVCRGRYVNASTGSESRLAIFRSVGMLKSSAYRNALFYGSTPPHQSTIFCPGARKVLSRYNHNFFLSADLVYFLRLSMNPHCVVKCLDLDLVRMFDGGVSAKQCKRRFGEVARAYRLAFGWKWCFPFFFRYLRRLASVIRSPLFIKQ
jgi:glycosyltransferase involved in cell wall biosynthesis